MKLIYKKIQIALFLFCIILLSAFLMPDMNIRAQSGSDFKISGYADTYYAYDNDNNGSPLRQFSVISPVRDQFRINLAQITGKYSNKNLRSTVTLQFGHRRQTNIFSLFRKRMLDFVR